jgi:hypothetical protein
MVMLLMLLILTSFCGLYIGLEHGLHEGHALVAPKLLVGLIGLRGLTCYCHKGLTLGIIVTAVQGIVGLVGVAVAVGFAALAKLLTAGFLHQK